MLGSKALEWIVKQEPGKVLDVGSGSGAHAQIMRGHGGHEVVTNSLIPPADLIGDYLSIDLENSFDYIWCCHCLEHILNPGVFLKKIRHDLKMGGYLAITVPPAKHDIVGGHVSLWNMGLLFYHLVLAGFDCSKARGLAYGYNISVIVQKVDDIEFDVVMDNGDIERLAEYFPFRAAQGFSGNLQKVNWEE